MAGLAVAGKKGFRASVRATERITVRITYEQLRHGTRKYGTVSDAVRTLFDRDMAPMSVPTDAEEWDS